MMCAQDLKVVGHILGQFCPLFFFHLSTTWIKFWICSFMTLLLHFAFFSFSFDKSLRNLSVIFCLCSFDNSDASEGFCQYDLKAFMISPACKWQQVCLESDRGKAVMPFMVGYVSRYISSRDVSGVVVSSILLRRLVMNTGKLRPVGNVTRGFWRITTACETKLSYFIYLGSARYILRTKRLWLLSLCSFRNNLLTFLTSYRFLRKS